MTEYDKKYTKIGNGAIRRQSKGVLVTRSQWRTNAEDRFSIKERQHIQNWDVEAVFEDRSTDFSFGLPNSNSPYAWLLINHSNKEVLVSGRICRRKIARKFVIEIWVYISRACFCQLNLVDNKEAAEWYSWGCVDPLESNVMNLILISCICEVHETVCLDNFAGGWIYDWKCCAWERQDDDIVVFRPYYFLHLHWKCAETNLAPV